MALGIIEINDAGIQVAVDDEIVMVSPGYAVLDGDRLLVGQEAMENARLLPRWTNNRFWNQLDTDPIPNHTATVRHHADLAFAHLESLWHTLRDRVDQVIFIVPGFYSREQLGLLLGMAREAEIPVTGIVDSALASVAREPLTPVALHLDIYLHRITLTALSTDFRVTKTQTVTVTETGIFTLWDRWANIIANQFIQTSRYDPMHQAASEQKLFDQLPDWIANLGHNRGNRFSIELGDTSHQVAVSTEQLMNACANIYPQIVQEIRSQLPAETANLFISHRFHGFPGFEDSLQLIKNIELVWLDREQPLKGVLEHVDDIVSGADSVSHVVSLPAREPRAAQRVVRTPGRPTHLLLGGHAVPIGASFRLAGNPGEQIAEDRNDPVCTFYPRGDELFVEIHDAGRVSVNGESPQTPIGLRPGDHVSVDGRDITLISVAGDG